MRAGKPISDEAQANMDRWAEKRYFWVPLDDKGNGTIVETLEGEKAYDHGWRRNWELVMGTGWRWLWPPNALLCRVGMSNEDIYRWPIAPDVERRLGEVAKRTMTDGDDMHAGD